MSKPATLTWDVLIKRDGNLATPTAWDTVGTYSMLSDAMVARTELIKWYRYAKVVDNSGVTW